MFLLPFLFGLQTFFFCGDDRMRDNANTWRQSLLLALFFAALDADIDIVGIFQSLLIGTPLLPEVALVITFAVAYLFDKISVRARADLFDLGSCATQLTCHSSSQHRPFQFTSE